MKRYMITFKLYESDTEHSIEVMADSKENAWDMATYEAIPAERGEYPYSAWVSAAIYKSGKVHYFNTHEGMPY